MAHYKIESPMFGSIAQINCEAGDTVEEGDVLFMMEAMKFQYHVESPADGIFYPLVPLGAVVSEGQMIGKVEVPKQENKK